MTQLNDPHFDPAAFMDATVDSPLATQYQQVPEGDYTAMIDSFDDSSLETIDFTYKKGPRAGEPGKMYKLNLPIVLQDAKLSAEMGRDRVTVRAQIVLDFDDDGRLSTKPDRNVLLGQIKAAVGQNAAGIPIRNLAGAGPLIVHVRHRTNEKDRERPYVEVSRAAPLR